MLSVANSDCAAIVDATLRRIRETQPVLNAFLEVDEDAVARAAGQLDSTTRRRTMTSPVRCMLVGVKDNFAVAGTVMRNGSRSYEARSRRDASAVRKLRQQGAVIVGRTRMTEIAFGATGVNSFDGGARNPLDLSRVPGGSSSGSAVVVAAGLCHAALGSDTGGSCRIPAALCGILGFKPTYNLVSRAGLFPLSKTLDHVGWLGQSVDYLERMLQALVDSDRLKSGRKRPQRVGILRESLEGLEKPVAAAFDLYRRVLESSDFQVQEVTFAPIDLVMDVTTDIMFHEAYRVHSARFRERPDLFGSDIRERLERGARITRASYLRALRERARLLREAELLFTRVDVVLSPTVPITAPTFEEAQSARVRYLLPRNARLHNLLGVPTLAFPVGDPSPAVSVQIASAQASDRWLLRVGAKMHRMAVA